MPSPPVLTPAEAAAMARRGGRAFLAGCTGEPLAVLRAVEEEPHLWRSLTLTGAFIPGVNERDFSALGLDTRVETIFTTRSLQRAVGKVAHLPMHYSRFWRRLAQPGFVDIAYVSVPPPRADGTVGLGLTADFAPAAIAGGARLVGLINARLPDMPEGPRHPLERFDAFVIDDGDLPEYSTPASDADMRQIADHIIGLLGPGDTLQLGHGKVQAAVLQRLATVDVGGMGFHGGMISGAMLGLLETGAFERGVTTGVAIGDRNFYRSLHAQSRVRFAPVGYTHAFETLASIERFVSINSVIEVDLTGQANAEGLGARQVSGQGGLVDFLRGARASREGRAILALPSTAKGGEVGRIVPRLSEGTPVSVARADVDIVVTEHGVAHLADLSLDRRADALIAIAAPEHRAALRAKRAG